MLISTKGRYALRVLIDLAEHRTDAFIPLKEIAERQEISEKYLENIVKTLVRGGILTALRGKGGGYRLAHDPDQYCIKDILLLMEGSLAPVACLDENTASCQRADDCRTLALWQGLEQEIHKYLEKYTIEDLMNKDFSGYDYVI